MTDVYGRSGVDLDAAARAVELIRGLAAGASRPEVDEGVGGFAGLFDASSLKAYRRPLLATSADGVGTKVAIAQAMDVHDTIGFVNPNDIHLHLVALDLRLFGVGPTQWAEQFITPARTEWMQFFYANFFWLAPSASVILLARGRWPEFRATTLAVITYFFLGYGLYVLFPAAPPRLVLVAEYTKNLYGYPVQFAGGGGMSAEERTGESFDNYVRKSVREPAAQVVEGFPNTMQSFQGLLTLEEEGYLIAFMKSLSDRGPPPDETPVEGEPAQVAPTPGTPSITPPQRESPGPNSETKP